MLVTSKEILNDALKNKYAVGAFNVENLEMVIAVMEAADEKKSPVIMQVSPKTVKYSGLDFSYACIKTAAERVKIPVACYLDHGTDFNIAVQAFRAGFTSIMIDGSKLDYEKNISLTKSVVDVCHANNIPVEGELGKVLGKIGDPDEINYTDPDEAVEFVKRTGVDFLAVSIGTAHGIYKGVPKLNYELLSRIHEKINIPLVMHGTSGVPDEAVKKCISLGICKLNYATDLRIAFTDGIKKHLAEHPREYDPKKYGQAGIQSVKDYVKSRIDISGSANIF